jgi:hypothetical protein
MNADGAILNFCPPDYVQRIVPKDGRRDGFTLACYVKLFFAEKEAAARRMLVDEMKMYNGIPQYRVMFEEIGASDAIGRLGPESAIPDQLLEISLANPSDDQIALLLDRFVRAGVDLPIIYPYVSGDDGYKTAVVERLCRLV